RAVPEFDGVFEAGSEIERHRQRFAPCRGLHFRDFSALEGSALDVFLAPNVQLAGRCRGNLAGTEFVQGLLESGPVRDVTVVYQLARESPNHRDDATAVVRPLLETVAVILPVLACSVRPTEPL